MRRDKESPLYFFGRPVKSAITLNLIVRRAFSSLVNVGLIFISVATTFVAAEFFLQRTELDKYIPINDIDGMRYYYEKSRDMGFDISADYRGGTAQFAEGSYEVFSNSYGCFDREIQLSGDYILLIGDSFTWGYASFEKKWGTELERRLGQQVLKCGVSGTGTRYQVLKAQKVLRLTGQRPRIIVVGYHMNDFADDLVFPADTVIMGRRVSTVKRIDPETGIVEHYTDDELQRRFTNYRRPNDVRSFVQRNSVIANLLWQEIKGTKIQNFFEDVQNIYDLDLYRANRQAWIDEAWPRHLDAVRQFEQLAERQGSQLVFVLIPSKTGEGPQEMANFLRDSNIQFIDLYSEFLRRGEELSGLYWVYDGHFNEKGNQLVGAIVAEYLDQRPADRADSVRMSNPRSW